MVAYPPLVATLLGLCQGYLARAGGVRDMAGACLGRLLTRPDCAGALADFVTWARVRLQQSTGPEAVFLIPGARPPHIASSGMHKITVVFVLVMQNLTVT